MQNNTEIVEELDLGGKKVKFSSGKLAKQANGSILVESGGNGILITATMSGEARENIDFFPLTVDVCEERMYAAGKIPGGFFREKGKASDRAILISRLTDRPLRPVFDKNIRNEIQVVATVLSVDQVYPYDVFIMNGASCALYGSDIPFFEPIGAVRIGHVDDKWIVNPSYDELKKSKIDIIVAGTETAILMVESKCREAGEELVLEAIEHAIPEIKKIIDVQRDYAAKLGVEKKQASTFILNEEVKNRVYELAKEKIFEKLGNVVQFSKDADKKHMLDAGKKGYLAHELDNISKEVKEKLKEEYPGEEISINISLKELERELVRETIIENSVRPDGRTPEEIRKISCEVGLFPDTTHGTGLFTRGHTQALTRLSPQAKLQVAVDAFHPSDNTEGVNAGAELEYARRMALRAGWQAAFQRDTELGLTLGVGMWGKLDVYGYKVDYGWAEHRRLGGTHRVTFGLTF